MWRIPRRTRRPAHLKGRLLARVLEERGLPPEDMERLAVGMLFLPGDDVEARETAREIVEQAARRRSASAPTTGTART